MRSLSAITGNATDQDKGRLLELADPFSGEPTGLKLWVVGPDSPTAGRARLMLADELADLADADGRVSAENREKARLNCLARHVLRWEVSEDGRPVPFSTVNLLTLLRVQWVQQQVDAFAGDRRNFAPEQADGPAAQGHGAADHGRGDGVSGAAGAGAGAGARLGGALTMDRVYIETKVLAGDAGAISGLAWKFGVPDRIGDEIEPGAFAKAAMPLPMLFGHDMGDPVGIWDAATEKSDGLHVAGKLLVNDVARAREVFALVKSGAVRGLSIGFMPKSARARPGGGRVIKSVELLEISLVTVPMHPGAKVVSAKDAVQALALASALNRAAMALSRS